MEEYFYIFCFLSLAIVAGASVFLILHIMREWHLYRLFSKNGDMRALLAKDAKRFHISIVYLMTYMIHSNGDNPVQYDKLHMIVRYIVEVIPLEYQVDAIKALKYLTDREKSEGKNTRYESVVDVSRFKSGKYLSCIKKVDDSYHYSHDIHATKMAEELALYLSEQDRLYIMYLLYRLAILDGIITTDDNDSELDMLDRICVEGLKIDIYTLDELINSFSIKKDQQWYDEHFADKDGKYPTSDLLANVFRVDIDELASIKTKMPKTSVLPSFINTLFISFGILVLTLLLCMSWDGDLLSHVYLGWFYGIGFLILMIMVAYSVYLTVKKLDSSVIPVLRTELENSLQKAWLNKISILGVVTSLFLNLYVANLLLMIANETFSNDADSFSITAPTTGNNSLSGKGSTTYYVKFQPIEFSKLELPAKSSEKIISTPNSICLEILKYWSGMSLFGITHFDNLASKSVSRDDYSSYKGKNIKVYFRRGYYGMIYKTGEYELTTDPISNPNQPNEFGEVHEVNP